MRNRLDGFKCGADRRPKQAAIQALEQSPIEPISEAIGRKIGHSDASADAHTQSNSLKAIGGPARI